ncbi:MFS transporter [Methylocystis sp. B8]|uniref:MFS transporter n=1 Tax=Methylocystis sp. B8 TaxID=544938 RepID=UPI0010FD40F5|nr:MFS transporter [Methylocystis sp. B8]TLG77683.1 MFS transporter [Methylocystis sp. B8]
MSEAAVIAAQEPRAPRETVDADSVVAKAARRLIPFLVTGFIVAYLDRVNIGFAALTMNGELGFTPEFFGWGAGVFFIGYCLFEAPSNYIMHRVGARMWIARIMVSWGVVSALTAFIWNEASFVVLRLLLGVMEAGFAPGVILYLTYWIPAAQRARVLAGFLIAVPVSSAIGSPISGLILAAMDGVGGISGWRWLFLMEATPSIILGIVCFFYLPDGPQSAKWLTPGEIASLQAKLESEAEQDHGDHWRALKDMRVLILGIAYFGIVIALYGLSFWLPQIIKSFGFGVVATSLLASIPYVCSALAMWAWSRSSDRRRETVGHTALAGVIGAMGLACAAYAPTPLLSMIALSIAAVGAIAALPTFWCFTTLALGSGDAVIGVAVINSIGNISGFAGPYLVGLIKGATGEFSDALLALALGPLVTALLLLRARRSANNKCRARGV